MALLHPSAGQDYITAMKDKRTLSGYIFQRFSIVDSMTVDVNKPNPQSNTFLTD